MDLDVESPEISLDADLTRRKEKIQMTRTLNVLHWPEITGTLGINEDEALLVIPAFPDYLFTYD